MATSAKARDRVDDGTRPAMDPERRTRKLDKAIRRRVPVRVERVIPGADPIAGIVLASSPAWTLLAVTRDTVLDGFNAVRTADIARIRRTDDEDSLTVRALRRRGQWPVPADAVAAHVGDIGELLDAIGRRHGLVALHRERHRTDACWIGAVAALGRKAVRLHEVDPEAVWHTEPRGFRYRHITRVGFAGTYERALREFAGPRP